MSTDLSVIEGAYLGDIQHLGMRSSNPTDFSPSPF
jgi:hypothetical protein